MIRPEETLRSIALAAPATIRVFERHSLDYCCGGRRPLAEAAAERNLDVAALVAELTAATAEPADAPNLTDAALTAIIRYILDTHHAYVRAELPRLLEMAEKVNRKHVPNHSELKPLLGLVQQLSDEMLGHLLKEEQVLFPYVEGLERALAEKGEAPHACFSTVAYPVRAMVMEHEGAAALMDEFRRITAGYTLPAGACPTFAGLYDGLQAFERDLHQHVHLENNLLFPRSIALEEQAAAGTR